MNTEIPKDVFSLHRYVDESGAPDIGRIFVREKGSVRAHLRPDLMKIITNQPDVVKDIARTHLRQCEECKDRYFPEEPIQQILKEE